MKVTTEEKAITERSSIKLKKITSITSKAKVLSTRLKIMIFKNIIESL